MRLPFLALLLTSLLLGGVVWYKATADICPIPIAYHIDTIDNRFNLTHEQAKTYLAQAEKVWEDEAGRDLFYYNEKGSLVVDFVFDERQELADSENSGRKYLDAKKNEHEEIFAALQKLQTEYDALSSSYEKKVDDYERRLNTYNQKVNSYNDQGGAPSDVFADLEKEKSQLSKESASLEKTSSKLKVLAQNINELGGKGNQLVQDYNREVAEYNKQFGFPREFTQGDYQGKKINVYKFSDEQEVLAVLAHEFGHALGLGHVEGVSSVMYYLLEDTSRPLVLSNEDKAALVALCGDGDDVSHKFQRAIRGFLEKFN